MALICSRTTGSSSTCKDARRQQRSPLRRALPWRPRWSPPPKSIMVSQISLCSSSGCSPQPPVHARGCSSTRASRMLEGKATVEDTDMLAKMQLQATSAASRALDRFDVLDCRSITAHIKKEFDTIHGPGWQCVVGCSFGCYFTHSKGSFIYFKFELLRFLVFKGMADEQPLPC